MQQLVQTQAQKKEPKGKVSQHQQEQPRYSLSALSTQQSKHPNESSSNTTVYTVQGQPLQARSSNSGTSVKRSDNISQSSYPVGDVSSDRAAPNIVASMSQFQLVPGQLTSAFQAQKVGGVSSGTGSTTNISKKESTTSARRTVASRRTSAAQKELQTSQGKSHGITEGHAQGSSVATRAAGRVTRAAELRAVKQDSFSSVSMTERSASGSRDKLLRPVKQMQSEQGTMRTTRSKSKAKAIDSGKKSSAGKRQRAYRTDASQISNGQCEVVSGNFEKIASISFEAPLAPQPGSGMALMQHEEESKQASPRSLNSSLIGAATEKVANQSFQINDSTDSVMENPLTSVIKQFQNLRTNTQQTGQDKPTIQQFLEKFEKEMQFLEDQYQAQQHAREEQMRLFEQHCNAGIMPDETSGRSQAQPVTGPGFFNDQQCGLGQQNLVTGLKDDTLMVQDTQTPCNNGVDQTNNSFISAVHGPNAGATSVFGSDLTSNEIYESFHFQQNSMLSFYPRQVRKILTRRKIANAANTSLAELSALKAPKHRTKIAKNLSKMHGLAVCQMNMMQILLQKISRRSKVIRKQERIVNDNLKRKRIYLERENFDLMSFLRNSLEAQDSQMQTTQSVDAQQKQKLRTVSDFNSHSQCQSTVISKSGTDGPTQSVKGSTTAANYGEDLSVIFGINSRKTASGRDNYQAHSESTGQADQLVRNQTLLDVKAAQSPEPYVMGTNTIEEGRMQRAETQMRQALHCSEIDVTLTLNCSDKAQPAQEGACGLQEDILGDGMYLLTEMRTPPKNQIYQQQHLCTDQRLQVGQPKLAQEQVVRKMNSTQNKRVKRTKNDLRDQRNRHQKAQGNNLMKKFGNDDSQEDGGYAIAELQVPSRQQMNNLSEDKICLTFKGHEPSQKQESTVNSNKAANGNQRRRRSDKSRQPEHQKNNKKSSGPVSSEALNISNKFLETKKDDNDQAQHRLSPLQSAVNSGQPFVQHSSFMQASQSEAQQQFGEPGFYHEYGVLPPDHFMMDPTPESHPEGHHGIFQEFMKAEVPHRQNLQHQSSVLTPNYAQPVLTESQLTEIALHRSQSVLLPRSHTQLPVLYEEGILPANNSGQNNFDQYGQSFEQALPQTNGTFSRATRNNTRKEIDPFFDENSNELSSIEQSHAAAPRDGYADQELGYNPYEQAKRLALKQQSSNVHQDCNGVVRKESQPGPYFVSPIVGMHTPQGKQDGVGLSGRTGPMIIVGQNTPTHFMTGVEGGGNCSIEGASMMHGGHVMHMQSNHHQQLSVGRMYGTDLLGMSAGFHGDDRQDASALVPSLALPEHDLSNMRQNYGNTPASLMGPTSGDTPRQNLIVSGWNLEDQVTQAQQVDSAQPADQIYQGHPNTYM